MNQVLSHLTEEERKIELRCSEASTAPWIADTMENLGNNWTICTLGTSQVDGKDHIVTTDQVHASELDGDAKSDAEFIASARTDIPTLLSTINALREERNTAFRLLESLTPGGSEFHDSPQRCVDFVRERLATTTALSKERNALRERVEAAEEIIESLLDAVGTEECRLDHHGFCQAHFIENPCSVADAKAFLPPSPKAEEQSNGK